MTNPSDLFGTNAALSGRTSVNAFNDIMHAFSGRGVLGGFDITPYSGMTVEVSASERSVAIAEDNVGNLTSVNLMSVSSAPTITLSAAPATNSRIDAIVAYVDNPATATSTATDNPTTVGAIAVAGTVAATPTAPTDNQIRAAITADGASGTTAYYTVLGYVAVANGTTTITSGNITIGPKATLKNACIGPGGVLTGNIASGAITADKIDQSNMVAEELIYEYTQTTDASSNVQITVPIDFTVYRKITFDAVFEPVSGSGGANISLVALDSGNNAIATDQVGIEVWQGNGGAFVNRQGSDLVAVSANENRTTKVSATLTAAAVYNYVPFSANSFGGDAGASATIQMFNGRILKAAQNIAALGLNLHVPEAGGSVRVYGVRR